jgi:hypothetical protein
VARAWEMDACQPEDREDLRENLSRIAGSPIRIHTIPVLHEQTIRGHKPETVGSGALRSRLPQHMKAEIRSMRKLIEPHQNGTSKQ